MQDYIHDPTTDLQSRLGSLPSVPGVYIHMDKSRTVIYVGKATNLRNRVRSYFTSNRITDAKTVALRRRIADFEVIVTDTEAEALLLENTLIKKYQPRYNILLRDDKSYPFIRITSEEFPRLFKTRDVVKDGSRYFGPYTDGTYLSYLLKTLRTMFPLRSCDLPLSETGIAGHRWKVCLDYHIGKCEGPCEAKVSRAHYASHIDLAAAILQGRSKDVEKVLLDKMSDLSKQLRFEEAAELRKRLTKLREYESRQRVIVDDSTDRDVVALARQDGTACIVFFTIRDGKLTGKRHYFLKDSADESNSTLLQIAVEQWYFDDRYIPAEILLQDFIHDKDLIEHLLRDKRGKAVAISTPRIGSKKKLIDLAVTNAQHLLNEQIILIQARSHTVPGALLALRDELSLPTIPHVIECFDNSHIQGTDYVSAMIVLADGKPKKQKYRKYRLRTTAGSDDYAAMREVIFRRYSHVADGSDKAPDLVVIDGGKGQLSAALDALENIGLRNSFPVVALAKRLEEVFVPDTTESLLLPKTSPALRLLQLARDEAHRFAVDYHRTLRSKRTLHTSLTNIPGIGKVTASKLLERFGSPEGVATASDEDLLSLLRPAVVTVLRSALKPIEEHSE